MVQVPPGVFWMGQEGRLDNEKPVHRVCLDGFRIGRFPVTNREYGLCAEQGAVPFPPFYRAEGFSHPEKPVVGVTWDEAVIFCQWLGSRLGVLFRLPTEAEWERAARGGLEGKLFPWGDEHPDRRPYAGYDRDAGGPEPVGRDEPNGFGLYDMAGGVHEWCSDFYGADYYRLAPENNPPGPSSGQKRASRGGSWRHGVKFSRCAARSALKPSFRYSDYGFRLARSA